MITMIQLTGLYTQPTERRRGVDVMRRVCLLSPLLGLLLTQTSIGQTVPPKALPERATFAVEQGNCPTNSFRWYFPLTFRECTVTEEVMKNFFGSEGFTAITQVKFLYGLNQTPNTVS